MKDNIDLIIIVTISVLMIPLIMFTDSLVRAITGIIFLLFIPGYSLISALFPSRKVISSMERVIASICTSAAIVIVIGIFLNYTPLGIRVWPVSISTFIFILICCLISWLRRRVLKVDDRYRITNVYNTFKNLFISGGTKRWGIVLLIVIVAVAGLLSAMYINSISSQGNQANEFYLLSENGTTDNYIREVTLGEPVIIQVVVVNHQPQLIHYSLELLYNGQPTTYSENLTLIPGEKWVKDIIFTPKNAGNNQKLEYQLYLADSRQLESSLYIYIDVINP